MGETAVVRWRLDGVVLEARPQLQIRAVRFEEMGKGTTLCPPTATMATQLLAMAEAITELKKLAGHAVAELRQHLTHVLKFVEMVKDTTRCLHIAMMETLCLAMDVI
jgi:hypothetical protein